MTTWVSKEWNKEHKLLCTLEDSIIKENLSNMPLSLIKIFMQAMNMLGRGRVSIVKGDKNCEIIRSRSSWTKGMLTMT